MCLHGSDTWDQLMVNPEAGDHWRGPVGVAGLAGKERCFVDDQRDAGDTPSGPFGDSALDPHNRATAA